MADFYVFDWNGRISGYHKCPEAAIKQARQLAHDSGGWADVEKRRGQRRRFFANGKVATIRKAGRVTR